MAGDEATDLQLFCGAEIADWDGLHAGVLVVRILATSDADALGWTIFQTRAADDTLFNVHVQGGDESFLNDAVRGRYLQINNLQLDPPDLTYNVACARSIKVRLLFDDTAKVLKQSEVQEAAPTCIVTDMTLPMTNMRDMRPNNCYNVIGHLESGGLVGQDKAAWAGRLVTAAETVEIFLSPATVAACNDADKTLPKVGSLVLFVGLRCDAAYFRDSFNLRGRSVTGTDWCDADLESFLTEEQFSAAKLFKHCTAMKPLLGINPVHYDDIASATPFESLVGKPDGNYVVVGILRGAAIPARVNNITEWRCGNWIAGSEHPCVEKDGGIYCKHCRMTVANAKAVYVIKIYVDVPSGRQELRIFENAGNALSGYKSCTDFMTAQRSMTPKQRESLKSAVLDKTRNNKAVFGIWKKDGYLNVMLMKLLGAAGAVNGPASPVTPQPRVRMLKRLRTGDFADD
ncbi:hypothetical protein PLESTB_000449400 [Pleodorina starrii]|uniref:Uncharacterized protein n=1 Tax=Pleodorina starrii TaxID=330485 RepID=A0A9W6BFP5_9CHLO|nr:hypothetical protein PLESTM_000671000 [Pleodorina starrii]GLC50945.1 hypothetical protein PLESTB_000449400 [Pleodorina starrii]GLC70422.1 hypothetical protein PLESTF_000972000 [Pleodorina starrii]